MRPGLRVLDGFQLASPCDMSWEAMQGDTQHRFCGKCEKHVYNLVEMDPEEIVALIERTEGRFCGRLYQRPDGTLLTGDCPVGVARLLANAKRRSLKMVLAAVSFAVGAGALLLGTSQSSDSSGQRLIETIEAKIPPPLPPDPPVPGALMPLPQPQPKRAKR